MPVFSSDLTLCYLYFGQIGGASSPEFNRLKVAK